MTSRPWEYDPVVFFFFTDVLAALHRGGAVNQDLLDRMRTAGEKSKTLDNSLHTTVRRVSWLCYMAGDLLLEQLEHPPPMLPPTARPPVTEAMLEKMKEAFIDAEQAALVDHTEYLMGDDEAKRKAQQLWADKSKKLRALAQVARKVVCAARDFLEDRRNLDAASLCAERFAELLAILEWPRDNMVAVAESLVEVHA